MDKSCRPYGESTSTTGRDHSCLNLSKHSHKISKATPLKRPSSNAPLNQNHQSFNQTQNHQIQNASPPLQPQQPPVYNINKNDFRDVVQKLTGPPAHERVSKPPPIHPPKPGSSRLQRIRPPPLAHVTNRPPPSLNSTITPPVRQFPANPNSFNIPAAVNYGLAGRPVAPVSPLPPLPTVHVAAESPVSAYMRYFEDSISSVDLFPPLGPLVSSCWNNFISPEQQSMFPPPPSSAMLPSHQQFQPPLSPLALGCLNSPRSGNPVFSPSPLFSPSAGQLGFLQLPPSPTVAVSSPKWKGNCQK